MAGHFGSRSVIVPAEPLLITMSSRLRPKRSPAGCRVRQDCPMRRQVRRRRTDEAHRPSVRRIAGWSSCSYKSLRSREACFHLRFQPRHILDSRIPAARRGTRHWTEAASAVAEQYGRGNLARFMHLRTVRDQHEIRDAVVVNVADGNAPWHRAPGKRRAGRGTVWEEAATGSRVLSRRAKAGWRAAGPGFDFPRIKVNDHCLIIEGQCDDCRDRNSCFSSLETILSSGTAGVSEPKDRADKKKGAS